MTEELSKHVLLQTQLFEVCDLASNLPFAVSQMRRMFYPRFIFMFRSKVSLLNALIRVGLQNILPVLFQSDYLLCIRVPEHGFSC